MDETTRKLIDSLPEKTGRSLDEWSQVLAASGLEKHGQMVALLKSEYGVTHGFANSIALLHRERGVEVSDDERVDAQYSGAKQALRPIYERLLAVVREFGDDVEVAPKRTSVSLRRHKQFAVVEAASAQRIQLGVSPGDLPPSERLEVWGGMCSHRVSVRSVDEVDDELVGWLRAAYERS